MLNPVVKVAFPLVGIWGNGELGEGFEVLLTRLLCEQDLVSEIRSQKFGVLFLGNNFMLHFMVLPKLPLPC